MLLEYKMLTWDTSKIKTIGIYIFIYIMHPWSWMLLLATWSTARCPRTGWAIHNYIDIYHNMIICPQNTLSIYIYIDIYKNPGFLEENPYFNKIWGKPGVSIKNLQNVRVEVRQVYIYIYIYIFFSYVCIYIYIIYMHVLT